MSAEIQRVVGVPEQVTSDNHQYEKELSNGFALAALFEQVLAQTKSEQITCAVASMIVLGRVLSRDPDLGKTARNIARAVKTCMPALALNFDCEGADKVAAILTSVESDDGTMQFTTSATQFELGKVVISGGVQNHTSPPLILNILSQYMLRDWGPLLSEDEIATNNSNADSSAGMIFAIYPIDSKREDGPHNQVYIVTSVDRSETKVCLPSEY